MLYFLTSPVFLLIEKVKLEVAPEIECISHTWDSGTVEVWGGRVVAGTNKATTPIVYNLLGKEVLSFENTDKIDVSGLSDGVYIIKISDGINETKRKFIKN